MAGIVVGVDGSPGSDAALAWAAAEAQRRDVAVTAILAWAPEDCPTAVLEIAYASGGPTVETAARQVLADAVRRSARGYGAVDVRQQPVYRDAVEALLDAAAGADLLVVGRHGKGTLHRLVTGSVSTACVRKALGSVVVVPASTAPPSSVPPRTMPLGALPADALPADALPAGTASADAAPVEGGLVLVGVDGSAGSLAALRWAAHAAARRGAATLRLVHAWSPLSLRHGAQHRPAYGKTALASAGRAALDVCRKDGLTGAADVLVETRVAAGGAARALLTGSAAARLLVVGAGGRGEVRDLLLGSVSSQCVRDAPCPVAVVREPATRKP